MFNNVILTGRLTADPELKTTPNNVSVCSFSIANDTGYGENKKTHFISCVAWRSTAEFISRYFGKGDMIGINGSIQTRKYTDKEGNSRTAFEVLVNNAEFWGNKAVSSEGNQVSPRTAETVSDDFVVLQDDDMPF